MQYYTSSESEINPSLDAYRLFEEMYQKSSYATFKKITERTAATQNISYTDSKAVVLGGQAGAGKSSLAGIAMREALEQGKGMCIIDDDDYRKFYPRHDDINWKIMATSRLESLISVFERGRELKKYGLCRSLTVDIHDETFLGLPSTLTQLESLSNMGHIQVYRRGEDIKNPILIYDSQRRENPYNTAVAALIGGRQEDRRRCIKEGIDERLERLKEGYFDLNAAERRALDDLLRSINYEMDK